MRAFKENPVFFSLTALLLLCSVTFSVLALLGVMKKSKTKTAFEEAQSRLERAVTRKPYPVQDNLDKSEENLAALEAARAEHESKLLAEGGLDLIPDGSPNYEQAVKERIKDGYIKSMRGGGIILEFMEQEGVIMVLQEFRQCQGASISCKNMRLVQYELTNIFFASGRAVPFHRMNEKIFKYFVKYL